MPKRITVAEHSSIAELEQFYKQATGGVESRKARALEASTRQTLRLAQGKNTEEVAAITGYSRT